MEIAVPRPRAGKSDGTPAFDFHWADNFQGFGDVSALGLNGGSATNRWRNYPFEVGGKKP